MNSDLEYLYLDISFNDECTVMNLNLGSFMYVSKLGLGGGTLYNEEAFEFLKSTIYGQQQDMCNFSILFAPDAEYSSLNVDLSVKIPSIKDVKFKNNKFRRNKRKHISAPVPCKSPKTDEPPTSPSSTATLITPKEPTKSQPQTTEATTTPIPKQQPTITKPTPMQIVQIETEPAPILETTPMQSVQIETEPAPILETTPIETEAPQTPKKKKNKNKNKQQQAQKQQTISKEVATETETAFELATTTEPQEESNA